MKDSSMANVMGEQAKELNLPDADEAARMRKLPEALAAHPNVKGWIAYSGPVPAILPNPYPANGGLSRSGPLSEDEAKQIFPWSRNG